MATFTEAVQTVEAMAAIPCLRGGFACFDDDLNAVGWYREQDHLGTIWVPVFDDPKDAAYAVRVTLLDHRRGLKRMIDFFEAGGDRVGFHTAEYCAEARDRYWAFMERLDAAADEAVA